MGRIDLNGIWQGQCLYPSGQIDFSFTGTVPGCVHTDLMGTEIPEDIYYRDTLDTCQWIEDRDWIYARSFHLNELPTQCSLVFDGLDTYADITLNGIRLGATNNMFIRHSFDVSKLLRCGENQITVRFHSPIRMVEGLEKRKGAFTTERLYTRRMQCTYGWDWVARIVTCGIFRDVYLAYDKACHVDSVYIYTNSITETSAKISVQLEGSGEYDVKIADPDGKLIYATTVCDSQMLEIDIKNAQLWYPIGYGAQPLYTLHVGDETHLFGIRTIEIRQTQDAEGSEYHNLCLQLQNSKSGSIYDHNTSFSGFELLINGVKIFCKGANWVPCEPFPSAETDEKIAHLLTLACEAGINMIRVWGGGIFEKPFFYNTCDRLGILVTQDFLMACGHYPEDDPDFISQLNQEAEYAAHTLRNHPCLVWWSGDNENAVRGSDDTTDYTGYAAIHYGLMPVISRLDPQRPFLGSSPYGGNMYASKTKGTTHNTQFMGCDLFPYVRNTDMTDYKEQLSMYLARFIAEEPSFGAICLPSLKRFMNQEDIFHQDDMWQYHTKGNPALKFTLFDFVSDFARKVLGAFRDGADRFFKLKYIQHEWVRISMENARRNEGFINGIVYWMWNDCWPSSSGWAFVDYYGLPKAAYYSLKHCCGPLNVSIEKKTDYVIHVCGDKNKGDAQLTLYTVDEKRFTKIGTYSIAAGSTFTLPESQVPEGCVLICDATQDQNHDRTFYRSGTLPIIPCPQPRILSKTDSAITLQADTYIHALELEGEFIFSDNYFSLLPGEIKTVSYRPSFLSDDKQLAINAYNIIF